MLHVAVPPERYTLGSCCKAGLLPFYFFHVATHGTLTELRPKILLSPLCYFEGPRNKYLFAAHRLFKTYAAGRKNNKKNNSRWRASFFLSSDLCSWVEEQEEKQQQVEHTCWKLVALQGLLTETELTQGKVQRVLDVNTQMLHQQLDMLCHVPGLEKHAQALKEKSSWPPSPQVPRKAAGSFDSSFGLGNFPVAPNWSAMRQTSADSRTGGLYHADDVLDRMTMASKQFQTMQIQIDALLLKAEELQHDAVAAYEEDRKSDAMSDATSMRRSVGADDVNEDVNDDLRARAVHDALDERFKDLLRRFQQRFQKEEQMQVKCREIVQSIASMIQKPIIQNEL
ncbi:unnamed protein product [Cladocopium goreaui]|uniref:Uncharacterized protein n=1 Tax=Cladocopium goreaui TaxID=2562237 RepID=A0A9P1DTN7_9DINO|nr:unnamed protein product [Cladocopium goreaui]